jgi:hypothetical protein
VRFQLVPSYDGEWQIQLQLLWLARELLVQEGLVAPEQTAIPTVDPQALALSDRGLATVLERLRASRDMLDGTDGPLAL